jgi:hypothetical protein
MPPVRLAGTDRITAADGRPGGGPAYGGTAHGAPGCRGAREAAPGFVGDQRSGKAFARASSPNHLALGFGRRSNVTGSTAQMPNLGP